jgi:uncharacterized membrane protein YfcA
MHIYAATLKRKIMDYIVNHWGMLLGGAFLGFFVGMLTALFGAGGGFIVTPALNIFLGLDMNLAVGTSAFQVMGASSFSLYHRLDKRFMGIRVALFTGIGIPVGAYLGVFLVQMMKSQGQWQFGGKTIDPVNFILLSIFAVFLLLIGGWLLFDNFYLRRHHDGDESDHVGLLKRFAISPLLKFRTIPAGDFSVPVLVGLGLFTGFLSGLLGIGGGVIMMPMLFYMVGQETKYATQTSTMLVLLSGAFSSIFHAIDHNINYTLAIVLIVGAFFGTKLGSIIHDKISAKSIRKYFAFVVLAAWLLVIFKLIKIVL